jgi:WD40 repeat protein
MVSMLYKTNIFGIVGSEINPDYKQNQVLIWDDLSSKILYKINLIEKVLNLKLRRDKVFIVTQKKIYILNSKKEFIISGIIDTGLNPNGLIAINYNEDNSIVVYPSNDENKKLGELTIKNLDNDKADNKYLFPHNHKIAYIALSYNGLLLVTASEDGRKIRIFDSESLEKLQELNRGKEKAKIKYISIDFNNQFLAASSERGTIHIWSLSQSLDKLKKSGKYKISENEFMISNASSVFAVLPTFLGGGFFDNEWSFAQVRLEEPYSIFHFGLDNSLIIITSSGKYYKAEIDLTKGGDCKILEECCL